MEEKKEFQKQDTFKRLGARAWQIAQLPWRPILKWLRRLRWRRFVPAFALLITLGILLCGMAGVISLAVKNVTAERIETLESLSLSEGKFDCILVLGCKVYSDGRLSHMLEDRVRVAVELYQMGVCNTLLMSGDHQNERYNEVDPMRNAAIAAGVPEDAIQTDPAGLSTYDSVARLAQQYQGKRVLIVTQSYHLYRALYLAQKLGLDAYGVSADLRPYAGQWKRDLREIMARCKDVYYGLAQPPVAQPQI